MLTWRISTPATPEQADIAYEFHAERRAVHTKNVNCVCSQPLPSARADRASWHTAAQSYKLGYNAGTLYLEVLRDTCPLDYLTIWIELCRAAQLNEQAMLVLADEKDMCTFILPKPGRIPSSMRRICECEHTGMRMRTGKKVVRTLFWKLSGNDPVFLLMVFLRRMTDGRLSSKEMTEMAVETANGYASGA